MDKALLVSLVVSEIIAGLARLAEINLRVSQGEPVTEEDLAAARRRSDQAVARLQAAVEKRNGGNH